MSEGIPQSDLFFLGKDGVKVPISGYKFGKDGIIVPDDNNSYNIGKDGVIIPKPGYTIGKGGIIVKLNNNAQSSLSDGIPQSDLFILGKDGVKVPITGYKFGKDGIIVPDDNNSYNIGKDGIIIPKPGYTIGKGGIIVKIEQSTASANYSKYGVKNTSTTASNKSSYNFQYSDMVLSIGGKILFVILLVMIILFGTPPLSFPANAVRSMLSKNSLSAIINSKNK